MLPSRPPGPASIMLTTEQCRKILGQRSAGLTDDQVGALRDSLRKLVNLIFDHLDKKRSNTQSSDEYL